MQNTTNHTATCQDVPVIIERSEGPTFVIPQPVRTHRCSILCGDCSGCGQHTSAVHIYRGHSVCSACWTAQRAA